MGEYHTSGYVDMFPIRNLYIVFQTLGTYNLVNIKGEGSINKKVPIRGGYNQIIYDQTVVSMDYLDYANQTLSRIYVNVNTHADNKYIYIVIIGRSPKSL